MDQRSARKLLPAKSRDFAGSPFRSAFSGFRFFEFETEVRHQMHHTSHADARRDTPDVRRGDDDGTKCRRWPTRRTTGVSQPRDCGDEEFLRSRLASLQRAAKLVTMKPTKLARLRAALAKGREIEALRIAAKFPILGDDKADITRGWAAYQAPGFYREIGRDPAKLVQLGVDAVRARYGIKKIAEIPADETCLSRPARQAVRRQHKPSPQRSTTMTTERTKLKPGQTMTRKYKGQTLKVKYLGDAGFTWKGKKYTSITALTTAITGSPHINGRVFFKVAF